METSRSTYYWAISEGVKTTLWHQSRGSSMIVLKALARIELNIRFYIPTDMRLQTLLDSLDQNGIVELRFRLLFLPSFIRLGWLEALLVYSCLKGAISLIVSDTDNWSLSLLYILVIEAASHC